MAASEKQRIDKWLFFTRVVKSRTLAAKLAAGGKVRVNKDKIDQASYQIKVGDILTITLDRNVLVYKVLAPGSKRGSAPEAQLLYENLTPSSPATALPAQVGLPQRESGSGRPTKRERRETDRLRGI